MTASVTTGLVDAARAGAAGHPGPVLGTGDAGHLPASLTPAIARATGRARQRGVRGPDTCRARRHAPRADCRQPRQGLCRVPPRSWPRAAARDRARGHRRVPRGGGPRSGRQACAPLERDPADPGLFASSAGPLIDQAHAVAEGGAAIVALSAVRAEAIGGVREEPRP